MNLPVFVGYEGEGLCLGSGAPAPELELGEVVHEKVELGGEGVLDGLVNQLGEPITEESVKTLD